MEGVDFTYSIVQISTRFRVYYPPVGDDTRHSERKQQVSALGVVSVQILGSEISYYDEVKCYFSCSQK